jgi:tetratricopeptide (TPR) repeat protein
MKYLFFACSILLLNLSPFAQEDRQNISIFLPEHDNITEVNLNQDVFIEQLSTIVDFFEAWFAFVPDNQKIALYLVFHPHGTPTVDLFSNPEIQAEEKQQFIEQLRTLTFDNTTFVDFPVLISMNSYSKNPGRVFSGLEFPFQKSMNTYKSGNLAEKYVFLKEWSATEVIPVLAAYMIIVSDTFAGVKNFGKTISQLDFTKDQNVDALTSKNYDYWRACMEMTPGNEIIPVTKVFMLVSQGKIDYAIEFYNVIASFSDKNTIAGQYLDELKTFLILFQNDINQYIQAGIEYHDMEYFLEAIAAYKELLSLYPGSAWATYELYFSENAVMTDNYSDIAESHKLWYVYKPQIYEKNPLYSMDVHASEAKEAWLLYRRISLQSLFDGESDAIENYNEMAMIALDLQVWEFAAQLFWYTATHSSELTQSSVYHMLYCLEKLGVSEVKDNFKGDFKKIFSQIDKDREKAMKESEIYKSFKK